MANCPNKSHSDWKALEAEYGKKGAYLQYVKNGFKIPSQDGVQKLNKKITIQERTDLYGSSFKGKDTLDSLANHPEEAAKMIDELNQLYPDVRVFKDRIIDENGNYLDIPSGKMGRHYRSAFLSAVAWSNDSAFETPPHEYAHEYIDMYRNVPIVANAITKYGEERLVTLIARKYAGQHMSNSFEKFLAEFWKTIRMTFGAPSMVDILTDSFSKNERLGQPLSRGTAIHNFQDIASPKVEKDTVFNYDETTKENTEKIQIMSKDNIEGVVFNQLNTEFNFFDSSVNTIEALDKWWLATKRKAASVTKLDKDATSDATNYSSMDQSIIDRVEDVIVGNNENKIAIASKIKGNDIDLNTEQQLALDNMYKIVQGTIHREITNASYINPNVTSSERIDDTIIDEMGIEETEAQIKHKAERLASKNKVVQWIEKGITKQLKWVTNSRLWAKYLSGSENSIISRVLYKGLNDGREVSSKFTHGFLDLIGATPNEISNGSIYDNKDATISELETETFELDQSKNGDINAKSLQLTKSELLMIYLMNRQEGGRANLQKGFNLNSIKGREGKRSDKYKLTDKQIDSIVSDIEADPKSKDFIARIDEAMEYNHEQLNSTYRLLEGFDLEKVKNYFPMFHGEEKLGISKRKNVIADMRNLRLRSAKGMSVRLVDPIKALEAMRISNAAYVGYAIPVHNAQKMIQKLESEKIDDRDNGDYIKFLKDNINQVQDSSLLYSGQGDKELGGFYSKLQGNFAVALLAYNPGVIFKQQVSLETAATAINRKYIRKSGSSLGGLNFINPAKLLQRLSYTGVSGGETSLPVEWKQITSDPLYQELIKYPLFRDRFEGMITRETGEAAMSRNAKDDLITIPFKKGKDGKPLQISKSRLMMGITMMDSITVMRLFEAVKLETADRMGEPAFASLSETEIEQHNINRLQEIVDKTQPTFDQTNRSGLAKSSNPITRALTMFSSATQKISEQLLDSMIDYNMNPTPANLKKLGLRAFHTAITTSIMLTTIDVLFSLLKGNWDDDDLESIPEQYAWGSVMASVGTIHVLGTAVKGIISEMDSKPWRQTVQDPVLSVFQEGYGSVSNIFKGNFLKALASMINVTFKSTGIPISPVVFSKNYLEKLGED